MTNIPLSRRAFLGGSACGIGSAALASLLSSCANQSLSASGVAAQSGLPGLPHFPAKAKRVLCLFQSGGMSHVDLFDQKPALLDHAGQELPPSVKGTQRVTGMTAGQAEFIVVPPLRPGQRCGQSGLWISNLLPHLDRKSVG